MLCLILNSFVFLGVVDEYGLFYLFILFRNFSEVLFFFINEKLYGFEDRLF